MPGPRPALLGAVLCAPRAAVDFYVAAFGWRLDGDVLLSEASPVAHLRTDGTAGWLPAFAAQAALATDIDSDGAFSLAADPAGATIAIAASGAGYRPVNPTPGHLSWAQLNTHDLDGHPAFYATALDWRVEEADNDKFTYRRFAEDEHPVAGVMRIDERSGQDIPVGWQLYFRAESVTDAAQAVSRAGGTVMVEPTEIVGGEFLVARDPHGNVFGVDRMSH